MKASINYLTLAALGFGAGMGWLVNDYTDMPLALAVTLLFCCVLVAAGVEND